MSLSFTPKRFIQAAPKHLIKEHFDRYGVGRKVDWSDVSDRQCSQVINSFYAAPSRITELICGEWRLVYEQADERGAATIIQAGHVVSPAIDLAPALADLGSILGLSFHTWLRHPKVFDIASKLEYADHVFFHKRTDVPVDFLSADDAGRNRLRDNLSSYFKETTEQGHGCAIDSFQRGNQLYYFCSLEDHPHATPAFSEQHELMMQSLRPAFEVIFVLNIDARTLETRAKGGAKVRRDVESVFGRSILKVDLGEPSPNCQTYNLNRLLRDDCELTLDPDDEIQSAILTSLKVRILGVLGTVTIDVPSDARHHSCYNLLHEVVMNQFSVDLLQVVQAKFRLVFNAVDGTRPKRLSFTVAHPDSCSLRADPLHEAAKNLLKRWGIDETGPANEVPTNAGGRSQYRLWH